MKNTAKTTSKAAMRDEITTHYVEAHAPMMALVVLLRRLGEHDAATDVTRAMDLMGKAVTRACR
jgi:hypothetical protein